MLQCVHIMPSYKALHTWAHFQTYKFFHTFITVQGMWFLLTVSAAGIPYNVGLLPLGVGGGGGGGMRGFEFSLPNCS